MEQNAEREAGAPWGTTTGFRAKVPSHLSCHIEEKMRHKRHEQPHDHDGHADDHVGGVNIPEVIDGLDVAVEDGRNRKAGRNAQPFLDDEVYTPSSTTLRSATRSTWWVAVLTVLQAKPLCQP